MADNNDSEVQGVISEFAITLSDLHKVEYSYFVSLLSKPAYTLFNENIELWMKNRL